MLALFTLRGVQGIVTASELPLVVGLEFNRRRIALIEVFPIIKGIVFQVNGVPIERYGIQRMGLGAFITVNFALVE